MNINKETVLEWLKTRGRSREWLSERCGAEMGTVNSWFSTRGFSDAAVAAIRLLMELDDQSAANALADPGMIQFTLSEFERIERARLAVGSPPRPKFYHDAIVNYIDHIESTEEASKDKASAVTEFKPRGAQKKMSG